MIDIIFAEILYPSTKEYGDNLRVLIAIEQVLLEIKVASFPTHSTFSSVKSVDPDSLIYSLYEVIGSPFDYGSDQLISILSLTFVVVTVVGGSGYHDALSVRTSEGLEKPNEFYASTVNS